MAGAEPSPKITVNELAPSPFGVMVTNPVLSCVMVNRAETLAGAKVSLIKSTLPSSLSEQEKVKRRKKKLKKRFIFFMGK